MEQSPAWGFLKNLFPVSELTKQQLEAKAYDVVVEVEEGSISALKTTVDLRKVAYFIECVLKSIQEDALKELNAYPEKKLIFYGCEILKKYGSVTANFSNTPVLVDLAKKQKELQDFAKKINVPTEYTDNDGVVWTLNPPELKGGEATFSLSIK